MNNWSLTLPRTSSPGVPGRGRLGCAHPFLLALGGDDQIIAILAALEQHVTNRNGGSVRVELEGEATCSTPSKPHRGFVHHSSRTRAAPSRLASVQRGKRYHGQQPRGDPRVPFLSCFDA
jgi:hypothetical protein